METYLSRQGEMKSKQKGQCDASISQSIKRLSVMVFISDGCSFHHAHIWSKSVIWLHRKSCQIRRKFRKITILHHTCATYSELLSYISSMHSVWCALLGHPCYKWIPISLQDQARSEGQNQPRSHTTNFSNYWASQNLPQICTASS